MGSWPQHNSEPVAGSAPERQGTPACCGVAMEPELAEARDREGRLLFVTLWRCPNCRRVTR